METNKIKEIIDKYQLVRKGDKVGTYKTKGINKAEFAREVGENKSDILAYFDAQEKEEADRLAARYATFEAIPGVAELRKARTQRAEWQRAFNRMMETGSGKMEYVEAPSPDELAELEHRNPIAVFALEAQWRANNTSNIELYGIWSDTYDALCDGLDPLGVKADHDKRMSKYTEAHLWD